MHTLLSSLARIKDVFDFFLEIYDAVSCDIIQEYWNTTLLVSRVKRCAIEEERLSFKTLLQSKLTSSCLSIDSMGFGTLEREGD